MKVVYANRNQPGSFQEARLNLLGQLSTAPIFHRERWQRLDISSSPLHATREIMGVAFEYSVPDTVAALQHCVDPDLPWAEEHFAERISGIPMNPGQTHVDWPYHGASMQLHLHNVGDAAKYDHNYMERMSATKLPFNGYRFQVGDLVDVIELLKKEPTTRQAFLPIWFPEDTGVTSGQRVPCTIGYHFLLASDGSLNCQYYIRSCDLYRHFTNDVYLACRLMQHVGHAMNEAGHSVHLGNLQMIMHSLHLFDGDITRCAQRFER